jgi:hypothetical protein
VHASKQLSLSADEELGPPSQGVDVVYRAVLSVVHRAANAALTLDMASQRPTARWRSAARLYRWRKTIILGSHDCVTVITFMNAVFELSCSRRARFVLHANGRAATQRSWRPLTSPSASGRRVST